MTPHAISTTRSRSGNGAPESSLCGTASTAARDTAPRNPATALTTRCRAGTRRSRWAGRLSTSRMRYGVV